MVHDLTEQDLVNLRRTIYLTIQSSLSFEECCHKLSKLDVREGYEEELCNMLAECCSQVGPITMFVIFYLTTFQQIGAFLEL